MGLFARGWVSGRAHPSGRPHRFLLFTPPGNSRSNGRSNTYPFQHLVGIIEVAQHALNVGFVGRPGQEAPKGPLHALHGGGGGWLQLRAT